MTEAVILVLDAAMWLLDGPAGLPLRGVYQAVTFAYYVLNPGICVVLYFYVDYQLYKDEKRLQRLLVPMLIPAVINLVLSIVSLFNEALFYIDESNVYHRGRLFLIMVVIAFFYLVYTLILTIINRKRLSRLVYWAIVTFITLIIIGALLETLFYGLTLVWPLTTFGILIVFVNVQNTLLYTDHLTGLFNRRQLDSYLHRRVNNIVNGILAGLMIDIDNFKTINDMYGHTMGDHALVSFSDLLKKTFRKNDFIARFGGDEFVVVMPLEEKDDLQKAIERLKDNVRQFNAQKTAPYEINMSIGYDCFFDQTNQTADDFIRRIDSLMYREKKTGDDT